MKTKYFKSVGAVAALLLFGSLLNSCGDSDGQDDVTFEDKVVPTSKVLKLDDKIYSVPSPLQFTSVIKEGGTAYNSQILNSPDKESNYSTNYSRSIALGVYGADLSYAIVYGETQDAFAYLNAIRKISSPLGLQGVFDENLLTRFKGNISNTDSLYNIIATAYLTGDALLKDADRVNMSGVILAGSWIESLYLATETYAKMPDRIIRDRIGEQKLSLESIIMSLEGKEESEVLLAQLKELFEVYKEIAFTYEYIESTTDVENKITTINSKTTVEITAEQIEKISKQISKIRNEVVGV